MNETERKCPKCGGPQVDLRGAGFNPDALAREQTCYAWGKDMFTCNFRDPKVKTPPRPRGCGCDHC